MHLGRGMEFWTGRSCKAQKTSISEAEIETENNVWLQKYMDVLLQLSVRRVLSNNWKYSTWLLTAEGEFSFCGSKSSENHKEGTYKKNGT